MNKFIRSGGNEGRGPFPFPISVSRSWLTGFQQQLAMSSVVLVKALYPYSGVDQAVPLPFAESAILLVAQRTDDGWCRGFSTGREGWFPASYVKPLENVELVQVGETPIVAAGYYRITPDQH